MRILKAGILYFAIAFAAGFALGAVRVLWAVPRFGGRTAELMELPIMVVVTILTARFVILRLAVSSALSERLCMGLVALALLLVAELALVRPVRGLSPGTYVATRDPVTGSAYVASLVVFALMPIAVGRPRRPSLPTACAALAFVVCVAVAGPALADDLSRFERERAHMMLNIIKKDLIKYYYDPDFHGLHLDDSFDSAS